jgi:hypothetical protein
MLGENTLPARPGYACELLVRVSKCIERFLGGIGDEDFLTRPQETIESLPGVAQQRRAACGGLEQAAGRAISHRGHFGAGHVERQAGGTEKPRMSVGGHVTDEPQVLGPGKAIRITGATQHKTVVRPPAGGLDEQPLQLDLPVMGVSAEVREIRTPLRIAGNRMVGERIDVSVQGRHPTRPQQGLEAVQGIAAGVAEYEVEVTQPSGGQILHLLACIYSRQRNRCIQVVKHMERAGRCIEAQMGSAVGVGAIRCDDRCIGAGNLPHCRGRNSGPVSVKHQLRARKAREIPMCGVVGNVFLEENDVVPARAQGGDETAPQGCVPVAPGRAECEAENDYLHVR